MEFVEGVGFSDVGNLVLDVGQKSAVQLSAEGSVTPLDMGSEVIEVNQVLHDALVVAHAEIFEVSLSFAFRVMWPKVVF